MRRTITPSLTLMLMLALGILPNGSLLAQGQGLSIEEVIVTARKIEESLNDAPVTVTAITASAIEDLDLNSISDVARFTPGLSFSSAFGRATERPVIRGQGNILAGVQFGVESGVAYFVDGMYYAGDISTLDMSNVERVEIIKGPQSALYGRNTYSGAVNFITRRPDDEFSGRLRAKGLEDEAEIVGNFGGEIIDDVLSASAALRYYEFDGQWTNLVTESDIGQEKTSSASLALDWTPNDAWSVSARLQYQEDDDGTRPFFLQSATQNNCYPGYRSLAYYPAVESSNPNQYFCGEIKAGPIHLNDGPDADGIPNTIPGIQEGSTFSNIAGLPFLPRLPGEIYSLQQGVAFSGVERELTVLALSSEYQLASGHSLVFQTSHRSEDLMTGSDSDHSSVNYFFPAPPPAGESFFGNTGLQEATEQTYELRLNSSPDDSLRYTLGVFYFDLEEDDSDITFSGITPDGLDNFITNFAVFGALTYDFSDKLNASLELRYQDEEKEQKDYNAMGDLTFEGAKSFTSVTPRLTLDYRLTDDAMLYGIYSEGIKPGGLNGEDGVEAGRRSYEEEESRNFEIGIKASVLDGRAQLNVALFQTNVDQYQLTTPIVNPDGALNSIVTNQADGEVFGLEAELMAKLSQTTQVGITYALADSEFTEGCDEFQWTLTSGGGKFRGDPATASNPSGMGDCSVEGHQFPMGSRHQASAWLDWARPLAMGGEAMEFFGNLNVSYESRRFTQLHQESYTGAATLVGARIGLRGENWIAALIGRNLTDEDSAVLATRWLQVPFSGSFSRNSAPRSMDPDTGIVRSFFALPRRERQIGLELSYSL